jgi:hypothetical protein
MSSLKNENITCQKRRWRAGRDHVYVPDSLAGDGWVRLVCVILHKLSGSAPIRSHCKQSAR